MALILPLVVLLLFASIEAGHFVWTQHKLTDGVRDGARFAGRMNINQLCNGATPVNDANTITAIKNVTRTGKTATAAAIPKVAGWDNSEILVTVSCQQFVSTGIYTDLDSAGPIVTVSTGGVTYPSLFHALGLLDETIQLSAKSNSPVVGI